MKHATQDEVQHIIDLRKDGYTVEKIAEITYRHPNGIRRILRTNLTPEEQKSAKEEARKRNSRLYAALELARQGGISPASIATRLGYKDGASVSSILYKNLTEQEYHEYKLSLRSLRVSY